MIYKALKTALLKLLGGILAPKNSVGLSFRCKNRFGDQTKKLLPCPDFGSRGHPGNLVYLKPSELPPAGIAPKCPCCGSELDPVREEVPVPVFRILLFGLAACLVAAAVWWLWPSGTPPRMVITPSPAEWGRVALGTPPRPLKFVISNTGRKELVISSAEVAGAGFSPVQGVTSVPAGESREAVLAFAPAAAGPASGTLTLTTNDPAQPTAKVDLLGLGVNVKERVEEIFAPIDNSTLTALPQ